MFQTETEIDSPIMLVIFEITAGVIPVYKFRNIYQRAPYYLVCLGGIMFLMWASLAAIAAGMLMGITAVGWRRSAGLIFALLIPALMFGAFSFGWDVSYHAITEERASRIQDAIESFYTENGRYPQELNELARTLAEIVEQYQL